MNYLITLRSRNRRNLTMLHYQLPMGGSRALPKQGLQPGTGAPMTEPGTTPVPVGSRKEMVQTAVDRAYNNKSQQSQKTTSLPEDKPKGNKIMKKSGTKSKGRSKQKRDSKPIYFPRGGRPKEEEPLKFTESDNIPSGTDPYRDGPSVTTPSEPIGKIGELPNAKQSLAGWNKPASEINNIRTLVQTIVPSFFGQFPSWKTDADSGNDLDKNQELIFLTFFNQIRDIYQAKFNLNTQFFETYVIDKVYVYFHDVHALHCELVVLLQRAAYYRNIDTGMENLVLDNLSTVLNTTTFYLLRNRMARALRFSYLPMSVILETYETFQTYRMGTLVTSSSTIYVTPIMAKLMTDMSSATTPEEFNTAVSTYTSSIDTLVNRVTNGRPNNTTTSDGIQRYWFRTASNGVSELENAQTFKQGQGGITQTEIQYLNSIFGRAAKSTNLTLLNNVMEGNSESHCDDDFNDRFTNHLAIFESTEIFPYVLGGTTATKSPSRYASVAFASERDASDVSYKAVMYQAEKFAGAGQLFFRTATNVGSSRFYLVQRDRRVGLQPEMDVLFDWRRHYAKVNDDSRPLIQDNYVCKILKGSNNTNYYYTQNVDSTAAAMWFLSFGDLMNKQYEHGINILK